MLWSIGLENTLVWIVGTLLICLALLGFVVLKDFIVKLIKK